MSAGLGWRIGKEDLKQEITDEEWGIVQAWRELKARAAFGELRAVLHQGDLQYIDVTFKQRPGFTIRENVLES